MGCNLVCVCVCVVFGCVVCVIKKCVCVFWGVIYCVMMYGLVYVFLWVFVSVSLRLCLPCFKHVLVCFVCGLLCDGAWFVRVSCCWACQCVLCGCMWFIVCCMVCFVFVVVFVSVWLLA